MSGNLELKDLNDIFGKEKVLLQLSKPINNLEQFLVFKGCINITQDTLSAKDSTLDLAMGDIFNFLTVLNILWGQMILHVATPQSQIYIFNFEYSYISECSVYSSIPIFKSKNKYLFYWPLGI